MFYLTSIINCYYLWENGPMLLQMQKINVAKIEAKTYF